MQLASTEMEYFFQERGRMDMELIVETAYGVVKGIRSGNISIWKGIPYAMPPVGSLRFQAPQKLEAWDGIREATQFGPVSSQPSADIMNFLGNQVENPSEDCLYLNIWSPGADEKRRPVMVWIHGGAFISGSGSSKSYDGASFAEQGDVVVVTINYRLGIFGFLHLAEIGGSEYSASGNCGILDQIAALQWVKENIALFGGDPNQVTVFGESAGAMSIGTLLALPSAKGLFHRAILQSGAARNVTDSSKATKAAAKLLDYLGIQQDELQKLEAVTTEKLVEASDTLPPMTLIPVVDGVTLPDQPENILAEGFAKDIPILIGTNKDEYRLFTAFDPIWKSEDKNVIVSLFEKTFGSHWTELSQQFPEEEELTQDLYDLLMTRFVFTSPAINLAECQLTSKAPVWMYQFNWETPILNGILKSCHALEIPFVWNTLHLPATEKLTGNSPDRQKLADQMAPCMDCFCA
jgi:para-nitrobenzyl esterase